MLTNLDTQSLLLMFLANELPAEDRSAVEQMLAQDPALQAQLDALNEAMRVVDSGLAALDQMPLPTESVLARRIGIAMRQRLVETAKPSLTRAEQPRQLRYPIWAYPVASAAAVALIMLAWWGRQPDAPLGPNSPHPEIANVIPAPHVAPSHDPNAVATDDAASDDVINSLAEPHPSQPAQSEASLEEAEGQLAELTRSQTELMPSGLDLRDQQ